MKPLFFALVLASACVLVQFENSATAQQAPEAPANQVALTAKQVEGFIAAQKDMTAATKKLQKGKPDPKVSAQLDSVATKYGFKGFREFNDVAATIAMIMSGIDPVSKQFQQPEEAIKQEIAEVNADKTLSKAQKTRMLQDLNDSLKNAQPIQHPANIELVKKYFDKIDAAVQ